MFLKVAKVGDDYLITWGKGYGYPLSYEVDGVRLDDAATGVRNSLQNLAGISTLENVDAQRRRLLINLANAGTNFLYELFNSPAHAQEIVALKEWIRDEYEAGDRELEIVADPKVQMPWGLVYDGIVPPLVDERTASAEERASLSNLSIEKSLFSHFWCLSRNLTITKGLLSRFRPRSMMIRPRARFGFLPLLNSDVEEQIHRVPHGCQNSSSHEEKLVFETAIGTARSLDQCNQLIVGTKQTDILLYFLGHHDDSTLELGAGETISDGKFSRLIDRLAGQIAAGPKWSCGLVFLNGCQSAAGQTRNLRYHIEREEFCGMIAAECRVSIEFAHRFGVRLLSLLINHGKCLGDAMRDLYTDSQFWPESLIFSCYANPLFAVQKSVDEKKPLPLEHA